MNMLLWLFVTALATFVGAQDHDGNGGEQGAMTDSSNNNNNSGGEGTDITDSTNVDTEAISYGDGIGDGNSVNGNNGGRGHGNGNGNGGHGEGGIDETSTYISEDSESSEVAEYIEDHPWVGYVMVGVALVFFCFFCNLACCMCKEAFCRGKCKHCSCNRGQRRKRNNNNMEERRQAEYTELQQV